ncbi:MAG: minor capsid protein [Holophagales bacterium]|jgi:SPP1 gp7 family putative phage head morphogenesis protein|nr:minor capsid protein [Holophagales bacterium]
MEVTDRLRGVVARGSIENVLKLLDGLKSEIVRGLVESGIDGTPRADWRWARLWKFLDAANETIDERYSDIAAYTHDATKGLVEVSTADLVHRINEAQGKNQLFPIKWTDESLDRIAGDTLIHGSKAADWWARQSRGFQESMGDQLRMGMAQGESIPELVKRIFPNPVHLAEAQKEGRAQRDIIGTAKRNAEALVRTSTLTVMREASMDVYAANSDVIKGVQWCATLDDRTTPLCQRLDGKVWLLPDYEPDGHSEPFPGMSAHWNCRSAILPEMKSWEDLAEEAGGDTEWARKMDEFQETAKGHPDEDGGAQRASKDGYVDARLSYEEWKNGKGTPAQNGGRYEGKMFSAPAVDADGGTLEVPELARQQYFAKEMDWAAKKLRDELPHEVPIAQDNLVNLAQRLIDARPSEFNREDSDALLEQAKNSSAMCIFLHDKNGELKPALIAFDEKFVKKRYLGEPMYDDNRKVIYGNDGYNYYTDYMPPRWQMHLTYCHELAHSVLPADYDRTHPGGRGPEHEALLRHFMTKLHPKFATMKYRRYLP